MICRAIVLLTLLLLPLLTQAGRAAAVPTAPASAPAQPITFRVLLLIKRASDLKTPKGACQGRMSDGDIDAVSKVFQERFPRAIAAATRGRVAVEGSVIVDDTPLTAVTPVGKGQFWTAPGNVNHELRAYTQPGDFDGVFVYWMNWDGAQKRSLPGGLGFSWPAMVTHGMGYSVVVYQNQRYWNGRGPATVFVHEWLHQLEAYYGRMGVRLPRGGLHGTGNYPGQTRDWYARFLNAELTEPDGAKRGLGEAAWQVGTPRGRFTPEYLTPERKARNLLRNASFEGAAVEPDWRAVLPPGGTGRASVLGGRARDGRKALLLESAAPGEVSLVQRVAVKPRTTYILSGWIAAEGVQTPGGPAEEGRGGASLALLGTEERSRFLLGRSGWTYACLIFSTGRRNQVDVAARLGGARTPTAGRALFDDLSLVELERAEYENVRPVD